MAIGEACLSIKDTRRVGHGHRKANNKNIFVDDLQATLDAHQAANQAKLIHKVKVAPGPQPGFRKLQLPPPSKSSSPSTLSQDNAEQTFPKLVELGETISKPKSSSHDSTKEALSTQDLSRSPLEHQSSIEKTLEYKGRYRRVEGQWKYNTGSYQRKSPGAHSQDNKAIDSRPRLATPEVTDLIERNKKLNPWIRHIESEESDGMLRLNEEIKAFERYMKPTSDEDKSTKAAIASAQSVVAAIAPSSALTMHGSRYTGIASPLSDIDFSVSLPEYEKDSLKRGPSLRRPEAQQAGLRLLKKIASALNKSPKYGMVKIIYARVNLVTAIDLNTELHLQFQTLASFMPAREYTMYYLSEFPGLRPLYVLLRHFLLMRGLTGARDGGIGSYPLLIMIVAAFKHSQRTFAPERLGYQLLHVLKFWATADLYTNGYSADPPIRFTKIPPKMSLCEREERLADPVLKGIDIIRKPKEKMPFLLCLQDPGDPTNDLGKRITEIKNIQACFTTARENLLMSWRRWETLVKYDLHKEDSYYTFLRPLMSANYSPFERQRRILANAHKPKEQKSFQGHRMLKLHARESLPGKNPETGADGKIDTVVSTSDGRSPLLPPSPGTSIDTQSE
ncbi:hypothetical protein MMC11_005266 [Xylographa trunciseda]|nr:hypothetical protein [Xylographa trunciseda]